MKKNDKLLIIGILIVAAAAALFYAFRGDGKEVAVYRDSEEIYRFSLNDSEKIMLEDKAGQKNELVIEDGKAYLTYADCPDKICVKQGKISAKGETIVCLPHKLVIEIE